MRRIVFVFLFFLFSTKVFSQSFPIGLIELTEVKTFKFDSLQKRMIKTRDKKNILASVDFKEKTVTFVDSVTENYKIVNKKIDDSYEQRMYSFDLIDTKGLIHKSTLTYLKLNGKWQALVSLTSAYVKKEFFNMVNNYKSKSSSIAPPNDRILNGNKGR